MYDRTEALLAAMRVAEKIVSRLEKRGELDRVREILLFGSCLKPDAETVSDIDMMIIDDGLLSEDARFHHHFRFCVAKTQGSKEGFLRFQFFNLCHFLLDLRSWKEVMDLTSGIPVDMHLYSEKLFTDPNHRGYWKGIHKDPYFYNHVFERVFRFNFETLEFELVDVRYFEEKYGVDLSDLQPVEEAAVA